MASAKNRLVLLLILAVTVLAVFTGCGGGGGDSDSTLDPDQLEVAAAVDAFSAAIRSENFADSDKFLDTNVKWYRAGSQTWDIVTLRAKLKDFFDKAVVKDFSVSGVGVNMISDTVAESRGSLSLSYSDAAGNDKPVISESIKMVLEKTPSGPWGLIEFGVYSASDKGSAFPPEL